MKKVLYTFENMHKITFQNEIYFQCIIHSHYRWKQAFFSAKGAVSEKLSLVNFVFEESNTTKKKKKNSEESDTMETETE